LDEKQKSIIREKFVDFYQKFYPEDSNSTTNFKDALYMLLSHNKTLCFNKELNDDFD